MDCSPPGSSAHGDSSGKNTGVDCYALLQWIFPNQGSNPGLLHCRRILYRETLFPPLSICPWKGCCWPRWTQRSGQMVLAHLSTWHSCWLRQGSCIIGGSLDTYPGSPLHGVRACFRRMAAKGWCCFQLLKELVKHLDKGYLSKTWLDHGFAQNKASCLGRRVRLMQS